MKIIPALLATLLIAVPATALADGQGNNHDNGNRGRTQPQQRYQQPQQRYQQPQQRYQQPQQRYQQPQQRYQQPQQRYQQPQQRYQQPEQRYQQPQQRYQQPQQRYQQPERIDRNVQPMPRYAARGSYGRIENPRGRSEAWGWNGGRQWVGDRDYWGGGFWGALSINLGGNDGAYGGNDGAYGYAVQANSPGEELLQQYGLQQTDCNQPNLVQIDGPDGGEICAYPNDMVGPGQYQVDPATLTLVSY